MGSPSAAPRPPRLRFTPRSLALAVLLVGVAFAATRLVASSSRVLGWVMTAAVVAGLLNIPVGMLARRVRRGLAVALVAVCTLASLATVGYGVGDDIVRQTRHVQRSAPKAAARLERSGRFADLARRASLARNTRRFVEQVPERLRGGTPVDALRSAATRGVAFLVTGVLTLFFLLHGHRLAAAGFAQPRHPARRALLERVGRAAYHRTSTYIGGTLAMAALAGLVAYAAARTARLPGPAALGLWMALWDIVPLMGALVGAAPLVLLAAALSPGRAVALAAVFLAYQVLEVRVLQPRVEQRSVRVGPFLTLAAGLLGLELYGLGGALMAVVAVTGAVAVADELAPALPEPVEPAAVE